MLDSINKKNNSLSDNLKINILKENSEVEEISNLLKLNKASINSKEIRKNDIFFEIKGKNNDGNSFIFEAIRNGASIVVSDRSKIKINNQSKIFKNNKHFKVGRYHSLKLMEPFKSNTIKITMRCSKTKIPMGFEDNKNKIYGFQFHPESFLTENGDTLIKKILSA